jgi:hypothetical protein
MAFITAVSLGTFHFPFPYTIFYRHCCVCVCVCVCCSCGGLSTSAKGLRNIQGWFGEGRGGGNKSLLLHIVRSFGVGPSSSLREHWWFPGLCKWVKPAESPSVWTCWRRSGWAKLADQPMQDYQLNYKEMDQTNPYLASVYRLTWFIMDFPSWLRSHLPQLNESMPFWTFRKYKIHKTTRPGKEEGWFRPHS